MKWKINRKNRRVQTLPHVCISVYIARGVFIYRRRLTPLWRSDPPRTSLKSRIAPQNCCTNNNQWKMLIQRCIRSTKVTAHEIGWTPTRNFGTIWFIRSLYWFFGPIRYASPAPHLIIVYTWDLIKFFRVYGTCAVIPNVRVYMDTGLRWSRAFSKWPPAAILDDRKSLSIAFLAISDQYATLSCWTFFSKWPPVAGGHFGLPKITFDLISRHFRSIRNFFLNMFFKMAAGCHFGSPISPQNNRVLLLCVINGYAKYEVDRWI